MSRLSSWGHSSASSKTLSCSGWRRWGLSTSMNSNRALLGSPNMCCCLCSTLPRTACRAAIRRAAASPAVGLSLQASSLSLSLVVEAVEAVELVQALLAQLSAPGGPLPPPATHSPPSDPSSLQQLLMAVLLALEGIRLQRAGEGRKVGRGELQRRPQLATRFGLR